ncbi:hypothetical protein BKA80DRAFT_15317 [Phyllosticta citrichinensis]
MLTTKRGGDGKCDAMAMRGDDTRNAVGGGGGGGGGPSHRRQTNKPTNLPRSNLTHPTRPIIRLCRSWIDSNRPARKCCGTSHTTNKTEKKTKNPLISGPRTLTDDADACSGANGPRASPGGQTAGRPAPRTRLQRPFAPHHVYVCTSHAVLVSVHEPDVLGAGAGARAPTNERTDVRTDGYLTNERT